MVWIEIALEKRIDWHSYGVDDKVILPPSGDIPSICKYPNGGLGITQTPTIAPSTYDTIDSNEDSDSDGANLLLLSTFPSAIRNKQIWAQKRARDGLQDSDAHTNQQGTMAERPPHATVSFSRHLDFEGLSTIERAVLSAQVQPSHASASNQADLIDITEGMEQVPTQSPLPL